MNEENNQNSGITILDIISIFLKNKKKIFLITGIVCVISIVLYFFVFDLIFYSTATIKSSGKSGSLFSGIEGIPDIGGLSEITGSSSKELYIYVEILQSRRCLEEIINKYNIMEKGEFKFLEDAIKYFRKEKLTVEIDKPSGLLYIGVYDKEPIIAKEMVELLLLQLDKINIELNVSKAKSNRDFIEKRYFLSKEELSKAEDSLKSFQLIYGVAPDLQIKAAAQSVFALEAELKAEEVKLDVLKKILSSDQPEVKTQESKLIALKNKITEMKTSTDLNDLLSLGNSPQIAMSYLRLQRELEVQTKILTFLLPIYEQAKIEEKRETPTILILENPYVAEKKSKPKRLTMVILSTFISFFILWLCIIVYELYIKKLISDIKSR